MNLAPLILLDFDGVLNAVTRQTPDIHPSDTWISTRLPAEGRFYPLLVSDVVLDYLRWADRSVEIKYLTSWREFSGQFAEAFSLPRWGHLDESLLDEPVHWSKYWKVEVARKVMDGNTRPILWMDDDIPFMPGAQELIDERREVAELVTISPDTSQGLTPSHLSRIEEFVRAYS